MGAFLSGKKKLGVGMNFLSLLGDAAQGDFNAEGFKLAEGAGDEELKGLDEDEDEDKECEGLSEECKGLDDECKGLDDECTGLDDEEDGKVGGREEDKEASTFNEEIEIKREEGRSLKERGFKRVILSRMVSAR